MAVQKTEFINPWSHSLFEDFRHNAEAIAAEVYRAESLVEAQKLVADFVLESKINSVVTVDAPLIKALELEKILPGGTSVAFEGIREKAVSAELGISELELAIAETGTLVQDASNINKRLVSTLPPIHLALVRTDRLVPTFSEAIDLINKELSDMAEYIAFISGPSRTADIERVLTIGVHGPGRLIILFVD